MFDGASLSDGTHSMVVQVGSVAKNFKTALSGMWYTNHRNYIVWLKKYLQQNHPC